MKPISLPIAELKPALAGLGKVISRHSTLPILATVKIDRTNDGWITLSTTDLDRFVTVRLEQPADGEPVSVVMAFEELLKTANQCDKGDTITVNADKKVAILSYPVGQQFAEKRCESFPADEWPPVPRIKGEPVPVNNELRQAIHEAMECASTDATRYILNGIFIDVSDPKCNQIVATDGRHMFSSNSFSLPLNGSLIIPDHKFLDWKGFNSDGEWQLRVGAERDANKKPMVQISSRRWRFITPQHEGQYPNYRQVIPTEFKTKVELPDTVLYAAMVILERIPCDLKSEHKPVCFKIDGKKLSIQGRSQTDAPWTEVEVTGAKATGDNVTICLNRDFALKALQFGLRQIEIMDEISPMKFSNGGKQMIVMPVRKEAVKTTVSSQPPAKPEPQPTTERSNMVANNTSSLQPEPETAKPSLETAMEQMEALRNTLKENLTSVTNIISLLKTAQREQKVTARDYSALRGTLKSLQSVRI